MLNIVTNYPETRIFHPSNYSIWRWKTIKKWQTCFANDHWRSKETVASIISSYYYQSIHALGCILF